MAAPEGYTKLGNVGYADKGVYSADATYNKYNVVYHEGSTYVALKDNLHGVTPANGENWRYMAKGFNEASADGITVIDTSGIIDGTKKKKTILQTFLDKVGDFIINKAVTNEALLLKLADYVKKTDIVQTESTATNKVPSSAYLKQVKADINSNFDNLETALNSVLKTQWTSNSNEITVGPGSTVTAQFPTARIAGFVPIGIVGFSVKAGLTVYQCNTDTTNYTTNVYVRNDTASNIVNTSGQISALVLYAKTFR